MSAVSTAARAAVRRRRLQTTLIALVVLFSTGTIVVAAALLDASNGPFDREFARQQGAHVVATYAGGATPAAAKGAEAVAGPFGQTVLNVPADGGPLWVTGPTTVVGRPDPAGPVDRVDLYAGRWATGLDEAVADVQPPPDSALDSFRRQMLGKHITVPGRPTLTIVGVAYSLSHTADLWVSPDTATRLHPDTTQMLYRFSSASTETRVNAAIRSLPQAGLLSTESYLVRKKAVAAGPGTVLPFLITFGLLGLITAVLIVANVVSGAVISGFRHIGVLKAIGFTPRQVVLVYLTMVMLPAVGSAMVGTVLGLVGARPLLHNVFSGLGFGGSVQTSVWAPLVGMLGVPMLVLVTALVPATRAYRLSAAEAISAGAAPKAGRALRAQRALAGARLPRAVGLGLGLPLARPLRTGLALAALLFGVTAVTFGQGLSTSVIRYGHLVDHPENFQVQVRPNNPTLGGKASPRTDPQVESLLRGLPGSTYVTADLGLQLTALGHSDPLSVSFLRGDSATLGFQDQLVHGRWMYRPDEVVAASAALHRLGLRVGDRLELVYDGRHTPVTVVGETMQGDIGNGDLFAQWPLFGTLAPDYHLVNNEVMYYVRIAPGTSVAGYLGTVRQADPGLYAWDANSGLGNPYTVSVVSIAVVFTTMIAVIALLSVLNTVLLTVRERRRDLGMLKSIGMTPRQVVVMVLTSTALLGVLGSLLGIPLGIAAHHAVLPMVGAAAKIDLPTQLFHVWTVSALSLVALSGIGLALLGTALPARTAARLPIAEVLHNE